MPSPDLRPGPGRLCPDLRGRPVLPEVNPDGHRSARIGGDIRCRRGRCRSGRVVLVRRSRRSSVGRCRRVPRRSSPQWSPGSLRSVRRVVLHRGQADPDHVTDGVRTTRRRWRAIGTARSPPRHPGPRTTITSEMGGWQDRRDDPDELPRSPTISRPVLRDYPARRDGHDRRPPMTGTCLARRSPRTSISPARATGPAMDQPEAPDSDPRCIPCQVRRRPSIGGSG